MSRSGWPGSTPSALISRRRTFTPGHWEIIPKAPKTDEVIFHHGDMLEQKVTFAGKRTADYVGRVITFRITVENGVYPQTAIGHQFNEVWIRANDA
ncbi:MAG: hypothetical protein NTV51_18105 [Verrucomicrobia bacterium]|nr:hypothetical protein [Verrucomicrobiota bacterium]